MVARWQPTSVLLVAHVVAVPPSPSSQVMNTAVEPLVYSGLFKIVGRLAASQLSPSATVPSCMSSIRFGVTKENAGSLPADRSLASRVYDTSKVAQPRSVVKYGSGLCRTAYSPELVFRQLEGIDSSYAFHISPWPKMLAAEVTQPGTRLQSPSNFAMALYPRPEVALT